MLISRRSVLSALPIVAIPTLAQATQVPAVTAKEMFEHRHIKQFTETIFARPEGAVSYQVGYDNHIVLVQKPRRVIAVLDYWKGEDEALLQRLLEAFARDTYLNAPHAPQPGTPDRCFQVEAMFPVPVQTIYGQGPVGYFLTDDEGRKGAIIFTHMVVSVRA